MSALTGKTLFFTIRCLENGRALLFYHAFQSRPSCFNVDVACFFTDLHHRAVCYSGDWFLSHQIYSWTGLLSL